ncbi:MAG: hypothetical protein EBU01_12060, partial [Crocinitomicaceae bacterium]|nr:hypothetical protein [Crocinitomicaceae bacterium]
MANCYCCGNKNASFRRTVSTGYSVGNFTALSSIGATFDFKVTTNGGVKLYINNEDNPYISDWTNSSSTSFTTSYVAT